MPDIGQREVARGSAWAGLAWVIGTLTGPLLAVLLVRSMSHSQYGALSVATDAIGLLAVVLSFGLAPAVSQVLVEAQVKSGTAGARRALSAALPLSWRAFLASVPLTAAVAIWFFSEHYLRVGFAALCVMAPVALFAPFNAVLLGTHRALQWPRRLAAGLTASSVAVALVVLLEVNTTHPTPISVAAAFALRPLVLLAVLLGPVLAWWRRVRRTDKPAGEPIQSRRLAAFAFAFTLAMCFGTLVAQLDVIVLGAFKGPRLAGLYSPASAIGTFVVSVPAVVGTFFQPAVTRLIAGRRREAVTDLYHWTTRMTVAATAPALAVTIVCPGSLLAFVFGPSLAAEALPLRVLGLGALVATVTGFNSATLDAHGFLRLTNSRLLSLIAFSVLACLVLVPIFGPLGAALATAASLGAENLVSTTALQWRLGIRLWDWRAAATVGCLGLSIGAGFALASTVSGDFVRCLVVAVLSAALTGGGALSVGHSDERKALAKALRSHSNPLKQGPGNRMSEVTSQSAG